MTDLPTPSVRAVDAVKACSEVFRVRVADITGPSHERATVSARQASIWVARRCGRTFGEIALFVPRDRATMIHAVRMIDQRRERNPDLAARLDAAIRIAGARTERHRGLLARYKAELGGIA